MKPPARAGVEAEAAPTSADSVKDYLGRLVKLIPTEVVGFYMVGAGILDQAGTPSKMAYLVWSVICLLLVIVVRVFGTSDAKNKVPPEMPLVVISAVSFVVWLYSLGGPFTVWGVPNTYAWMAVLVWTFVIPYLYKPQ